MATKGKIKRVKETDEERTLRNLQNAKREMDRSVELGIIPANPTRQFKINQRVSYGNLQEVYVRESHAGGLYYLVEAMKVARERDKEPQNELHYIEWQYIYAYNSNGDTKFAKEEKFFIRMSNSGIMSLLYMIYGAHAGIDFDVDYQRDYVWDKNDKVALIDSIFNNIEIGKFVFVRRNESTAGKYYEVLDGKQRLTALREFFEDRFKYKGKYFSELSFLDRHHFLTFSIAYGTLENPTKEAVYQTFIKLNTCGRVMDAKHLNKVKKLLKESNE